MSLWSMNRAPSKYVNHEPALQHVLHKSGNLREKKKNHVIKIGLTHMNMEHSLECRVSAYTPLSVREILD